MAGKPELDCYLFETWRPRIRPASRRRAWMDATPESFAYRCLPLAIANEHGWEIDGSVGFAARWKGGSGTDEVEIVLDQACEPIDTPVSLFGQGTITFHIAGLFRTSPGWNLWVSGPPNHAKHGIAPLTGVIETDWSPYSFTMNWRFTWPNQWVRFEAGEPICFLMPIERGLVDGVEPRFRPIAEAPELERQFRTWSRSRDAFQAEVKANPPRNAADKWQKLYYRGLDPDGSPGPKGHQSKLRTRIFSPPLAPAPADTCPARSLPPPSSDPGRVLALQAALRSLSPRLRSLAVRTAITADEFLDRHYAANIPLLLSSEDAPVAEPSWTSNVLSGIVESTFVPVKLSSATVPPTVVAPLLNEDADPPKARAGRSGARDPFVEEQVNRFVSVNTGRLRVLVTSPADGLALYDLGICDLIDRARIDDAEAQRRFAYDVALRPSDALFLPAAWWSQSLALEDCIVFSHTTFSWNNDGLLTDPGANSASVR